MLRDGRTGLVSNEADGTVSVIDLASATKRKDIQVGPRLSHPEGIAVDPRFDRAYVAVANSDQVAVIDTKASAVERLISVERPEGLGTAPVDVTTTPRGELLLVAEAGADQIGVFELPGLVHGKAGRYDAKARAAGERVLTRELARGGAPAAGGEDEGRAGIAAAPNDFRSLGAIPTAQYPTDVEAVSVRQGNPCGLRTTAARPKSAKRCAKLLWLSGKGLGTGPNPNGPNPDVGSATPTRRSTRRSTCRC